MAEHGALQRHRINRPRCSSDQPRQANQETPTQEVQVRQRLPMRRTKYRSCGLRVVVVDQSPWVKYDVEKGERQVSIVRSD